jgi:hypothetical protein
MLKRSAALALATIASIGLAASISTDASAKPMQVQKFQSSPQRLAMPARRVTPIVKPKLTLNPNVAKQIKFNPKLVAKPTPKFPPIKPGGLVAIKCPGPFCPKPPGNNNNNNNNNNNTNTNTNTNTNVNTNINSNSSVSFSDAVSVAGAAAVGGAAVVGGTAVAAGPVYAARPAARGCLTKEYLQTGQVLFRDLCTNEWAANPPAAAQ